MDWPLFFFLQVTSWPFLSALFTVEAEQRTYEAEFRGDVVMGCRFKPQPLNTEYLTVTWHRITPASSLEVYRLDSGVENLVSQDPQYRGRVRLLAEELSQGRAKLQVSNLRMNDSGTYQCLVQMGVADYKKITLSIKAPYKTVTKRIQKSSEGDEVQLTCESEGYPTASVIWTDRNIQRISSNTSAVTTPDQLFRVTSKIQVRSSEKNNYTCNFTDGGPSARFDIPDEIPITTVRNDALVIALCTVVVLVVIIVAVLTYRRQKGSRRTGTPSTRNLLVHDPVAATASFCTESVETLGEFLKAHYSRFSLSMEVRHFCQEKLPQRLQNSEGQPVSLQALLPEAGETLLLEGPPGSGKTAVAQILVSSWAEGPTHALLQLSVLHLLFSVDGSNVKGDLFQGIMTQLSLGEKISTEGDLRTVLSGSREVLLLFDGYREGNQDLDESLRRFLREKEGCRVLVTACPGHCPKLKEIVGTRGFLKLQI
uniref:programmed cell death 1 ligand 1-like n=1 Tax=Centroberyx gerrardi TaxID=166262 RepID=UPI003AB0A90C